MNKTHGSNQHRTDGEVVFYENRHTLETRHCFVPMGHGILRFHDGFTAEDNEQGWTPVLGALASAMDDAEIAREHVRLTNRPRV